MTKARDARKHDAYRVGIGVDSDAADDVGAEGTPTFFLNGRRVMGAQPFEKFKAIIDEEITHAQAELAKGTAPASLYDTLIRGGRTVPVGEVRAVAPPANDAPSEGRAKAKVVIQEFADFQCPFCRRVEPVLANLLRDPTLDVRIVWRDLPLTMHPDAQMAAEAAREAKRQKGDAGFWRMHNLLLAADANAIGRTALDGFAREIGLDMGPFDAALDAHTHAATVAADAKAAADAGITGTPGFLIGPYYLGGSLPESKFRRLIARAAKGGSGAPAAVVAAGIDPRLGVVDEVLGHGAVAHAGDRLSVQYVGTLADGTVFDDSHTRDRPFSFVVGAGSVIKGWDQGLLGMHVGGKRKLVIPPELAYGEKGVPPKIPPGSTLTFEVELVSIP